MVSFPVALHISQFLVTSFNKCVRRVEQNFKAMLRTLMFISAKTKAEVKRLAEAKRLTCFFKISPRIDNVKKNAKLKGNAGIHYVSLPVFIRYLSTSMLQPENKFLSLYSCCIAFTT